MEGTVATRVAWGREEKSTNELEQPLRKQSWGGRFCEFGQDFIILQGNLGSVSGKPCFTSGFYLKFQI